MFGKLTYSSALSYPEVIIAIFVAGLFALPIFLANQYLENAYADNREILMFGRMAKYYHEVVQSIDIPSYCSAFPGQKCYLTQSGAQAFVSEDPANKLANPGFFPKGWKDGQKRFEQEIRYLGPSTNPSSGRTDRVFSVSLSYGDQSLEKGITQP